MDAAHNVEAWAVVEHGKPLLKITRSLHPPTESQVVMKVTHCGVCHSDLHLWEGFFELGGNRGRVAVKDAGVALPRAVGHEIVGEVVGVGPKVNAADVHVGAQRIVYPWIGCNAPECTSCGNEEDNLCPNPINLGMMVDGGFASHVVVPHPKYLIGFGSSVAPAVACTLACSGLTVLSAVRKLMPMIPTNPVVLIGAGGLGIQAIAMLRALGHQAIISVDIAEDKRAVVEAAGAQYVCGSGEDARKKIAATAMGPILGTIDFVNNSTTAQMAYDVLAKGGHMVQVGIMGGELSLSLVGLIFKAVTLSGNMTGNLHHLREVVQLAESGKLAPIPTTEIPWNEADNALARLSEGKVSGRLVLRV